MAHTINTALTPLLALITAFWAIGFLSRLAFLPGSSVMDGWIVSSLLSILAVTAICLVSGLANLLRPCVVVPAYLFLAIALIAAAAKRRPRIRVHGKARPSWIGLIVAAILALVAVRAAIYPFTAWDTLMRYAQLGKLFAGEGRLCYPPTSPADWLKFSEPEAYPPLIPLVFTWIFMFAGSDYGARLINPAFLAVTCVAISATAREVSGRKRHSALAPLLFLSFPAVILHTLLHNGYTDQPILFFYTCCLYFAITLKDKPESTILLGIALGLALLTKYSALCLLPAILLTGLLLGEWRKAVLATLVGILIALVWYSRSYLITGNPFHPLFFNIFGDRTGSVDELIYFDGFSRFRAPPSRVLGEAALWTLGRNGSLFVSAIALLQLVRRRVEKIDIVLLLWLAIVIGSSILMSRQDIRFGLFSFVVLSLLAARFLSGRTALRWTATGLAIILILIQNSGISPGGLFSVNYFAGAALSQDEKKLSALGEDFLAWQYINSLPDESVILTPDNRSYYLERRTISLKSPLVRELLYEKEIEKMKNNLRKQGITHILAYDPGRSPIGGALAGRSNLLQSLSGVGARTVVLSGERYRLLRLDPDSSAPPDVTGR